MNESDTARFLATAFTENRERLLALAERNLKPILQKRLSSEDVLSATYEACAKRLAYFAAHTDVPVYFKLRTLLFQTLDDLERKNLGADARDAYREVSAADRQILILRHFDGLGNGDCSAILGIEPKAASIRHVRALERLQRKLTEVSCFKSKVNPVGGLHGH